jgi:hypothetical protein
MKQWREGQSSRLNKSPKGERAWCVQGTCVIYLVGSEKEVATVRTMVCLDRASSQTIRGSVTTSYNCGSHQNLGIQEVTALCFTKLTLASQRRMDLRNMWPQPGCVPHRWLSCPCTSATEILPLLRIQLLGHLLCVFQSITINCSFSSISTL